MRINFSLILSSLALSIGAIGCGSPAANNAVTAPVNSAVATTNTNGAANIETSAKLEGEPLKVEEAGLQLIVPKPFKASKDGEETVLKRTDGGVEMRVTTHKDVKYETVRANATKEMAGYLTDVKVNTTAKERSFNDMAVTEMTGTGKTKDGKSVTWNAWAFNAPKSPVMVTIYGEKENFEKSQTDIKRFLDSIKKQ